MKTVGYINIPLDLMVEILLRLPGKSLFKFRCVSKTWCSLIRSRQFEDAFMSLSLSRPRLLLAFNHIGDDRLMFFSAPHQSCNLSSSSSMVVAKNNTLTMPIVRSVYRAPDRIVQRNSVRGFVCCSLGPGFAVCNPSTGQVINLPDKPSWSWSFEGECYMYLGYDPINGQYNVLRLDMQRGSNLIGHGVFTLGGRQSQSSNSWSWRRVKSTTLSYKGNYNGVCIDGVVYFQICLEPSISCMAVSSFDVVSEQLSLLKTPENLSGFLTNYLGKLAACHASEDGSFILWVLDDVQNQVWSKRVCVSSFTSSMRWGLRLYFAGMTAAGEIVYVPFWFSDPFEVLCYHVEKKVERRVRVEGLVGDTYYGVSSCTTSGSRCFSSLSCVYVDNIAFL